MHDFPRGLRAFGRQLRSHFLIEKLEGRSEVAAWDVKTEVAVLHLDVWVCSYELHHISLF